MLYTTPSGKHYYLPYNTPWVTDTKQVEETPDFNLFEEMFGQDSAFMDDNFGG